VIQFDNAKFRESDEIACARLCIVGNLHVWLNALMILSAAVPPKARQPRSAPAKFHWGIKAAVSCFRGRRKRAGWEECHHLRCFVMLSMNLARMSCAAQRLYRGNSTSLIVALEFIRMLVRCQHSGLLCAHILYSRTRRCDAGVSHAVCRHA
jgi:hypothetical protein